MGIEDHIQFLGPQPMADMYPQLDVVLLTSISEGQPLVILEAYAAGLPVVATDVGACRELIEGCVGGDAAIGPSGIVTRVANPTETAAALVFLAKNRDVREAMGRSGHQRVTARYRQQQVEEQYDSLYTSMETWQESAGNLNA
jgi:glycosyltransferase involved in cell wall biosynthesis